MFAETRTKWQSLALVVLLHLLLGWMLVAGLSHVFLRPPSESLDVFVVRDPALPPPAPPIEKPLSDDAPAPRLEGAPRAPSPPPEAAEAAQDTADVPPPVAAGIVPSSGGTVSALEGDPDWMSPGSGSGGGSSGAGAGGGGTGSGDGGDPAVRARLRSGRIVPADYPPAARGRQGTVVAQLDIDTSGRVSGCTVTRSSGSDVLDEATCRLIRERFRFAPAQDAEGRPVPDVQGWQQRWWRG